MYEIALVAAGIWAGSFFMQYQNCRTVFDKTRRAFKPGSGVRVKQKYKVVDGYSRNDGLLIGINIPFEHKLASKTANEINMHLDPPFVVDFVDVQQTKCIMYFRFKDMQEYASKHEDLKAWLLDMISFADILIEVSAA